MVRWVDTNRAARRRPPVSVDRPASVAIAAEVATHSAAVAEIAGAVEAAMPFAVAVEAAVIVEAAAEIAVADAEVDEERHEESTIEST